MPLRDHFRPPIHPQHSWEGFHGQWPGMIVRQLVEQLPEGFYAEPRVHLGNYFEVDVGALESESSSGARQSLNGTGGAAPAPWSAPAPTATMEIEAQFPSEYEVLVFDENRQRRLVAAVEFVSPANKDRPEHRRAFATKCAAMAYSDVCVSIVDLVTIRKFNLYAEMLELACWADPTLAPEPPEIYAVTFRRQQLERTLRIQSWAYPLKIGQPLPVLPMWLDDEIVLKLDLEASYEETCRVLRIP